MCKCSQLHKNPSSHTIRARPTLGVHFKKFCEICSCASQSVPMWLILSSLCSELCSVQMHLGFNLEHRRILWSYLSNTSLCAQRTDRPKRALRVNTTVRSSVAEQPDRMPSALSTEPRCSLGPGPGALLSTPLFASPVGSRPPSGWTEGSWVPSRGKGELYQTETERLSRGSSKALSLHSVRFLKFFFSRCYVIKFC